MNSRRCLLCTNAGKLCEEMVRMEKNDDYNSDLKSGG